METAQVVENHCSQQTELPGAKADYLAYDSAEESPHVHPPSSIVDYYKRRKRLLKKASESHFAKDVPYLSKKERKVEEELNKLRNKVVQGDHSPLLLDFYESKKIIEESLIFEALCKMPKGAHLHVHATSAIPIDFLMELTREDSVYYSFNLNLLQTKPNGFDDPNYEK